MSRTAILALIFESYILHRGHDQTGHLARSKQAHLTSSPRPDQIEESPDFKKNLLLGSTFLGMHAKITPSAVWMAGGVIQLRSCLWNQVAVLWAAMTSSGAIREQNIWTLLITPSWIVPGRPVFLVF